MKMTNLVIPGDTCYRYCNVHIKDCRRCCLFYFFVEEGKQVLCRSNHPMERQELMVIHVYIVYVGL
jgi:hypothetical protein